MLSRRGTNLMPSLIEFLKAKGSEEEEKRTNLIGVLREINNALQVCRSFGAFYPSEFFMCKVLYSAQLRLNCPWPVHTHQISSTRPSDDSQEHLL